MIWQTCFGWTRQSRTTDVCPIQYRPSLQPQLNLQLG